MGAYNHAKTNSSITISFRISSSLENDLKSRAQEIGCSSVHSFAREIFLSGLAESDIQASITRLQEEIGIISEEILDLRHDIHFLMVKLLATLADISDDEAEQTLLSSIYQDDDDDDDEAP